MSRILRNDVKRLLTSSSSCAKQCPRRLHLFSSTSRSGCQPTRLERPSASNVNSVTPCSIWARHFRHTSTSRHVEAGEGEAAARAIDAPKPPLAIVFTDIVKSTAIWEKDPQAMSEAMDIHDDLLRRLLAARNGFEVKQNGDGFMIAFKSAISALEFCLDVQIQLQEQDWPQALLEMGQAGPVVGDDAENSDGEQKDGSVLWKGLRLRMSAHFGEPVCKWNGVINRMDYLGPAVNRAARFVSVCEGGQIVASEDFLRQLMKARRSSPDADGPLFSDAQAQKLESEEIDLGELESENAMADTRFEVRLLGERHFKGVSGTQKLFFIIPESLLGRLKHFPQHKFVQASKGNLVGCG